MTRRYDAVVLAAALALAACGSDRPAPRAARPSTPSPAPVEEAEPEVPEAEKPPEFVYSPVGKRDPFRSPFADRTGLDTDDREGQELTPLQRWNLEQLQVQAVITGTSSPMAMVVDPDGEGHIVRRGTLIGKNWGKVTAIRRDCIVITEQRRDATGAVSQVRQERCLPQDEGEATLQQQRR